MQWCHNSALVGLILPYLHFILRRRYCRIRPLISFLLSSAPPDTLLLGDISIPYRYPRCVNPSTGALLLRGGPSISGTGCCRVMNGS